MPLVEADYPWDLAALRSWFSDDDGRRGREVMQGDHVTINGTVMVHEKYNDVK